MKMHLHLHKGLSLLLAGTMLLGLTACGGGNGANGTSNANNGDNASNPPSAAGNEGSSSGGSYSGESFTISMASDAVATSDQNAPMVYFEQIVEEKSGGAIQVEVEWGGVSYDNAGIWEALSTGLLDMDIALMNKHTADAPLMSWGFMPYSKTAQESIDQTNWLLFENESTSKAIGDYFANVGMTILGNSADGAPAFITSFAWDGLDDLVSKCSMFGTMQTAKYQSLGLSCTSVTAPELYDNLSRGIIDGGSSALATALTNSLYEVAPYACVDGQYTSAVLILANSDFWNGLSDEAKNLIQECVDETSAFSAEHVTESTQASAEQWEQETGNPVKFLEGEDAANFWAQTLGAIAANAKANSAGQSYEEAMKTILTEWVAYQEQYHNIEIDWEW